MIYFLICFLLNCYINMTCSNCTVQYSTRGLGSENYLDVIMSIKCAVVCPLPPSFSVSFNVTKLYVLCHKKRVPSWWLFLVTVKLWIDVFCQYSLWIKKYLLLHFPRLWCLFSWQLSGWKTWFRVLNTLNIILKTKSQYSCIHVYIHVSVTAALTSSSSHKDVEHESS